MTNFVTDATIVVDHVYKEYEPSERSIFRSRRLRGDNDAGIVHALKDVTFVARKGESIGVIGQNGSGKSTLFRIMSGKDVASSGNILVSSEPSLLGVSAAMQRHLTGVQNITLGCLAMGMDRRRIDAAVSDISDFCDIGSAINRPLSTYSSGMSARLKFAIATTTRPEILLVDEALSTGDASFNERATDRMKGFLDSSGTVLVVSHSARAIESICERAIWLHEGELIADGLVDEVAATYNDWSRAKAKGNGSRALEIVNAAKANHVPTSIEYEL